MTKMIVNRLNLMLSDLIATNQTSFTLSQQGIDNIVNGQELIQSLRYTKAKKDDMILKHELEKVYDRMEWSFVKETLRDAFLPPYLVDVIIGQTRRSICRFLWNGELTDSIKPSRGLKHGDPLSPYLFVLCTKRLSQWIKKKVDEGVWRPLEASKGGLKTWHMFIAYDLLLFAEAGDDQVNCIKNELKDFCRASSQRVNFSKFLMFVPQTFLNKKLKD